MEPLASYHQHFFGSISDHELTRCSGLMTKLEGKGKVSVMVDHGFTIQDQLKCVGVELNIPPFLDAVPEITVGHQTFSEHL